MNFLSVLKQSCMKSGKAFVIDDEILVMIQKRLLAVFDDIIDICKEHHIPFQLSGGTCLGAVRHKGYIPWDDDIDINMFRADLDKFIPLFAKKYGHKYHVQVLGKTKDYNYIMVHILTKDVYTRGPMEARNDISGLCLDIFPIENTPDNAVLRRLHGVGCMGFRYILSCLRFRHNQEELFSLSENLPELRKYVRTRTAIGSAASVIPVRVWCKWAQSWITMCKNEHSEYVVIASGQHPYFRELYKRAPFQKSVLMEFEGRKVPVTADYQNYLKILYGDDYMQIPPPEKREKHAVLELDVEALRKFAREHA